MPPRSRSTSAMPLETSRSRRTSEAVLNAAVREFAENGFAGARIDRIASLANVNKTALYYHFGNKDELFAAALEFGYAQFRMREQELKGEGNSVIADLERLVGALFDSAHENRLHASLIADENRYRGKHLGPALRARIRGLITPVIDDMSTLIQRGQREGVLRKDLDVTRVYLSVISLSMFYLTNATTLSAVVGLDLSEPGEVALWRDHVISFVVAALRSEGGGQRSSQVR